MFVWNASKSDKGAAQSQVFSADIMLSPRKGRLEWPRRVLQFVNCDTRQVKGAATVAINLLPPRHIPIHDRIKRTC